jgi:phytoene dehydrogenase-like protein
MSSVVIGGGLAGLSAALTLQEAGEEVTLYEASDSVGGRVRSDYIDGFILDRGFQLINSGYSEIKRLKVIAEIDFVKADRSVDVMTPFGLQSIGDPRLHLLQGLRSPLGSLREKTGLLLFMGMQSLSGKNLEVALIEAGTGNLYQNLLKPFLTGVFLVPPAKIDARYGQEILKSFVVGDSGLPAAGVGVLSEALAARIENIELNYSVESLADFSDKTVILATDYANATRLIGVGESLNFATCHTWYHSLPAGAISSKRLRLSSAPSPVLNSIALSNLLPSYAPPDRTLVSTTTLTDVCEEEMAIELEKFWQIDSSHFEVIKRYEINGALPVFSPATTRQMAPVKAGKNIYLAGDYQIAGSQNGALRSGRVAAQQLLLDKGR